MNVLSKVVLQLIAVTLPSPYSTDLSQSPAAHCCCMHRATTFLLATRTMARLRQRSVTAAAACAAAAATLGGHTSPAAAFVGSYSLSSSAKSRCGALPQTRPLNAFGVNAKHQASSTCRGSLFSSAATVDETAASSSPSTADSDSDSTTGNAPPSPSKVVARGEVVHFTPAPPSSTVVGSVAAIRLRDEDVLPAGQTVEQMGSKPGVFGAKVEQEGVIDADEAQPKVSESLSSTKTSKAASKAAAGQGEDFVGRSVTFPSGKTGVVIAERPPIAFVMCDFGTLDEAGDATADASASVLGEMATIQVTEEMMGMVVDYRGRPFLEGYGGEIDASEEPTVVSDRAIFAPIPKVGDIALINEPMLTGKAMVDALAPLGKGQNTLLVGADRAETRSIGIDALATQIQMMSDGGGDGGVKCIYALTSSDPKEREDVLTRLDEAGIADSVVVVAARGEVDATSTVTGEEDENASAIRSAAEAVSVAAAASAIGEAHALSQGRDALVVVDSIDEHKAFWDWTTRVLVDVYGVDAVVKDDRDGGASSEMRGFFSALIQRAGQFNKKEGSGSVTLVMIRSLPAQGGAADAEEEEVVFQVEDFDGASQKVKERIAILTKSKIPLTPANLKKIQIPVPVASDTEHKRRLELQHVDDLISMSDGQIWLDEDKASAGQSPSLDPQRSITRIGIGADTMSRADAPAMRNLVGGLRFELAQAAALEGAGEGSGADRQIRRRDAWLLAMQQEAGNKRTLSENVVALLAASMGALDSVVREGGKAGTEKGSNAIQALMDAIKISAAEEVKEIDNTLDLTDDTKAKLEDAINAHFEDS